MAMTVKAKAAALDREYERAMTVAHTTAALGRVKKFPDLNTLLKPKSPKPVKKAKTWEKQLAGWAAHLAKK